MYQFRSTKRIKSRPFYGVLLAGAAILATMAPAHAATANVMTQLPQTRQEISQTKLSTMKGADITRIDWRQPQMKLRFDLAESDWIDGIDLILAMTPQGNISRRTPVLISLNNSPPLKLNPHGQSFDARLRFDASFVRAKGNVITIRVPAPNGAPCLTSEHGQWDVNTRKSSIVVRTRAKSRNLYLREVVERLKNPTTAPKTISILASGPETARLQMLAAQGIALQMQDIPSFRTRAGRSDMEIIIGRRDQLGARVTDRGILSETGSKISVHKGRPMRLVITGDDDFQVTEAVKSFASHGLPSVRRRESSAGELNFQRKFADNQTVLSGKTRFSELGQGYYAVNWRGTPNVIKFNVTDPTQQSGKVLLRLSSGPKIAEDSRVKLELNGKPLGFTTLDRSRKSVSFEIPEGALQGVENELKIIPVLNKNLSVHNFGQSCPALDDTPGFFIADNSIIELTAKGKSPVTELSRLTANGGLFAANSGANTHVVLSAKSNVDIGASLKIMAKLAQTSGSGWTDATVSRSAVNTGDKNVLIIGPSVSRTAMLGSAPRALSAALKGQSASGHMARNAHNYTKFASADGAKMMQAYAAKTRSQSRIGSGGVAAIYPDGNHLIGVISSTPGRSFTSVSQDLMKDKQWNALSGSVARWNSKNVLMAQTAIAAPSLSLPKVGAERPSLPKFDMAWLEDGLASAQTHFSDMTDVASLRIEGFRNDMDARFAGVAPAQDVLAQGGLAQGVKLAAVKPNTAPVYVSKKTRVAAQKASAPTPASAARPTLKPVKVASLDPKISAKRPLVMKLRGFSVPDSDVKADSRAPKWLTQIVQKIGALKDNTLQSKTTARKIPASKSQGVKKPRFTMPKKLTLASFDNAIRDIQIDSAALGEPVKQALKSDKNPLKKLAIWSDRTFGFFGILLALAFLLTILLLGLVKPDAEDLGNY